MTSETTAIGLDGFDSSSQLKENFSIAIKNAEKKKEKFKAIMFLSAVTGVSALIGFGSTVAAVRKRDPKYFDQGVVGVKAVSETGASLALRALGWGSLYAITGCGVLFYGIWKLSGARNFEDFRMKMGSILPRIPKNNPPQSRTEFEGLTDLLTYISEDWGKEKGKDTE